MSGYKSKKAGDALRTQRRLEQRYEESEKLGIPKRIIEWINKVLKGHHQECARDTYRNIHYFLRDGVALCKLINILLKEAKLEQIKFKCSNANTAFVAMENIDLFNQGAQRYGVPDLELFLSNDLYEGNKGPLLNVINCLNCLGYLANEKGFEPRYDVVELPPCANSAEECNANPTQETET